MTKDEMHKAIEDKLDEILPYLPDDYYLYIEDGLSENLGRIRISLKLDHDDSSELVFEFLTIGLALANLDRTMSQLYAWIKTLKKSDEFVVPKNQLKPFLTPRQELGLD